MPKKKVLYPELRAQMARMGYNSKELGEMIGAGPSGVSRRLSAKQDWFLEEVYAVCQALEIPLDEIYLYFPKGGVPIAQRRDCHEL